MTTHNLAAGDFSLRFSSSTGSHRRNSIRAVAAEAVQVRLPAPSLYEVLRIERHASPTEIKSAYRSLAKRYHPDAVVRHSAENVRTGEAADGNFIQIRSAYETLSDPSARAMYDRTLTAVNGGRHRQFPVPLSQNDSSTFYATRRWETDQCW
ncbi:chaperone protein dnaJ 11, chloroplastic-like [Vigna unguiculata]|uniref:Molecular chaperone DnaJ n=1 Tax=Vigna unguiculata TaxID=3917 RepID=A0A4D6KQY6_VIGUN|nr:chaperone protein dnaJ 11, chloroplastic-like [Vigna unguiculata]QCD78097.1 molecular chaperone DnaJ [Vigna unguiculata]